MNKRFELRQLRQFRMFAIVLLWLSLLAPALSAETTFLKPEQAFKLRLDEVRGSTATLHWSIAPGYYLYRDRLTVSALPGETVGEVVRPAGKRKSDPNFGEVEVYHDSVRVQVDASGASALQVGWQGCAEEGLCYPPQQQTLAVKLTGVNAARPPATGPTTGPVTGVDAAAPRAPAASPAFWSDSGISKLLRERTLLWTLPLSFVLGIALAFTPCVLPMLPIVSGMVVGSQASPRRAFVLALAFVLPMAMVYALLGLLAALAGASLQAWMQNPWTLGAFAAIFVLLAFAMFGFYELQLPAFLRDRLAGSRARGGSVPGAAAMGAISAVLVGPCMTAPLAGTLLYIAQSGQVLQGALLLLTLGLGMGLPLVVVSTFGARWLPGPGPWMDRLKAGFGFLMLATALWMLQRILPESLMLLLWGGLLTAAAFSLWHLSAPAGPARAGSAARVLVRSGAAVAALWGAAMVLGAASGAGDPTRPLGAATGQPRPAVAAHFEIFTDPALIEARLERARAQGQPALVEFSAEWCTSCKTIEKQVFSDPAVVLALDGIVLLRADVTASDAPQREWMRRHQVMGPPTVMLFDIQGIERRAERLVGEFPAAELLRRTAVAAKGGA